MRPSACKPSGVAVERSVSLTALSQNEDGVTARLERATGEAEESTFRYVIACDGAHSAVRHALGIGFAGEAFPMPFMLGDVHIARDLPRGMSFRALRLALARLPKPGEVWPVAERKLWLQLPVGRFKLIYKDEPSGPDPAPQKTRPKRQF